MTDRDGRESGPDVETGAVDAEGDVAHGGAGSPAHRVDVESPSGTDATADADLDADLDAQTDAVDRGGGQLAGAHPDEVDRRFDWRGWTLVVATFVSFLVIPGIIALYPHLGPRLGLTFWDTYLALPLIPAVVLALLAVWATTRP